MRKICARVRKQLFRTNKYNKLYKYIFVVGSHVIITVPDGVQFDYKGTISRTNSFFFFCVLAVLPAKLCQVRKWLVVFLPDFSRAWRRLHVFASNPDWFIALFACVLIG